MDAVAGECKTHRHHPEWSNTYNTVFVRWTTHSPPGLSEKDVRMAELSDAIGARPESIEITDPTPAQNSSLSQLASQAGGADCCSPPQSELKAEQKEVEEVEKEEGAEGSVAGIGGQPT